MTDQAHLDLEASRCASRCHSESNHRCYVDDSVDGDDFCAFDGDLGSCDVADSLASQGLGKADCPHWRHASAVSDSNERVAAQVQTKALMRMDAAQMRELAAQADLGVALELASGAPEFKGSFGHGAYYHRDDAQAPRPRRNRG